MTRYTHAIICRIPNKLKFENKNSKVDLALVRKQQEDLCETLREAGVDVIELPPEENCTPSSLFTDDVAVVINGTALMSRPKKSDSRIKEIGILLQDLAWHVEESPTTQHGKPVQLEGSDVLYTGREIFVGVRKNGTNMEGAMVVGRAFPDLAVVPVHIFGDKPLKHHVCLIGDQLLAVGKDKEAQQIVKRMEREATFRYKTLTMDDESLINCLNVNDHLIFRQDCSESKFKDLREPIELWGVTMGEMTKLGGQLSQFFLLVKKIKNYKNFR